MSYVTDPVVSSFHFIHCWSPPDKKYYLIHNFDSVMRQLHAYTTQTPRDT